MARSPLRWLFTWLLRALLKKKTRAVVVIEIILCNSSDVNEERKKVSGEIRIPCLKILHFKSSYVLPSQLQVELPASG